MRTHKAPRRVGSRLARLALLVAAAVSGSCYNPDFSTVLYKCGPGYVCPGNLTCINGKHCTFETPGCSKGGIKIAGDTFVCPGDGNSCRAGYRQCPTSVTTELCHLDITDQGLPEGCAICCRTAADM